MQDGLINLPTEIIEMVLAHLPLTDLLTTCSLVCTSWRDIISQPRYLPWRKLYHRYKINPDFHLNTPDIILHHSHPVDLVPSHIGRDKTLIYLLQLVHSEYSNKDYMFTNIVTHKDYQSTRDCLSACSGFQEISPEVELSTPTFSLVTAWLCLTSTTVWEVREVMRVLLSPTSPSTGQMVTEFLYMLSVILLHFTSLRSGLISLPSRLHYNIHHALYLYQHDWAGKSATPTPTIQQVKKSGQVSLLNMGFSKKVPSKTPTAEQLRIIQHPFNLKQETQDLVKIIAFAGTGKTTTLVRLTEAHPNIRFLMVVYNKSVRQQAESLFPKANVVCKTVHQMAMAKAGWMFSKKLTSNLKAKDILDSGLLMEMGDTEGSSYFQRGGQVLSTLTNFMNSPDLEQSMEHVPSVWKVGSMETSLTFVERAQVLADSQTIWFAMSDKENMKIRMPHDGYLKVWQLRQPNLQWVTKHDVLLLDEGQDMNPAMLDLFMTQKTARVIVGDPHQQIYMFRGAVNALDLVQPSHTYYLTQSFRFGPEIAWVANECLIQMKRSDSRTLVGGKKIDSVMGTDIIKSKQVAYICRTNIGLFTKLENLMGTSDKLTRIGLVGGVESYNFQEYLDIYHLMKGQNEKMMKYKNFKSFAHFKAFATNVNDSELLGKLKTVEKFKDRIPTILNKVKDRAAKDIKTASVLLSTVHKAKGLEFDSVVLINDFPEPDGDVSYMPEDEKNLLYVALTRAKTKLMINDLLEDILSIETKVIYSKPYIYQPHPSQATCGYGKHGIPSNRGGGCGGDLSDSLMPGQMTIMVEKLEIYKQDVRESAILCSLCAQQVAEEYSSFLKINRGTKRKR